MGCAGSTPQAHAREPLQASGVQADGDAAGERRKCFFLAVNKSSGGLEAAKLIDLGISKMNVELPNGEEIETSFFNLKDTDAREKGFKMIAELAAQPDLYDVRVVACGGDGTVKWVISCLRSVDSLHVPIGVIPFGTGNDLSRVIGWGSKPPSPLIGPHLKALRERLQLINDASQIPLDVWQITINLAQGSSKAKFVEIKDKKMTETYQGQSSVTFDMVNYFSCGADGELMFTFELNRKNSQLANKRVYTTSGAKQTLIPPPKLKSFLEKAEDHSSSGAPKNLDHGNQARQLLFLNIPSYGSGADPWKRSEKTNLKQGFSQQYVGDEMLEVLSIVNTHHTGMNLVLGSTRGIKRLTQGKEFRLSFLPDSVVYFQTDGEAIKAYDVASVSISHSEQVQLLRAPKAKALAYPSAGSSNSRAQNNAVPEQTWRTGTAPVPEETWRTSMPAPFS